MWPGKAGPRKGGARGVLFVAVRSEALEWALCAGARWHMQHSGRQPLRAGATGMAAVVEALHSLAAHWSHGDAPGPGEVRVVVADYWLRMAAIPWSRIMQRAAGRQGYVRTQLAAAGHAVESDDVVRYGDGLPGRPVLAVVYPASLWAALAGLQRELGAPVTSVLPCSVLAWSRLSGQPLLKPAMLGVSDGILGMLLRGTGHELQEVTVRQGDKAMLAVLRQRVMLREAGAASAVAADTDLPVVDLEHEGAFSASGNKMHVIWQGKPPGAAMPSAWLQLAAMGARRGMALDAVQPVAAMTPARILVALAVLAMTGLMVGTAWRTATEATILEHTILTAPAAASPAVPAAPTRRSEAEIARIRHVNQAIRTLNMPIASLLRAMNPPEDLPVSLLSVQVVPVEATSGRGTLRLLAQAPGSRDMTAYVAYLAERRPFTSAILVQHEQDETMPSRPYRFTVEVRWQP